MIKEKEDGVYYLSLLSVVPKVKDADTIKYQEIVDYSNVPLPYRKKKKDRKIVND